MRFSLTSCVPELWASWEDHFSRKCKVVSGPVLDVIAFQRGPQTCPRQDVHSRTTLVGTSIPRVSWKRTMTHEPKATPKAKGPEGQKQWNLLAVESA